MNNIIIARIVIGFIIVAGIAYFIGLGTNTASQKQPLAVQTQQGSNQPAQQGTLEQQQQCATDGANFFQNWLKTDAPNGITYGDPKYHYSQKLNACLAYVAYETTGNSGISGTAVNTNYILYKAIYNIYSNALVIQSYSSVSTTCNNGCSSDYTPLDPFDNSVPNLTFYNFGYQYPTIMSQ